MKFTEENLIASITRERFFEFFKEFWPEIIHEELVLNWHIEYLCDELQYLAELVFSRKPREYNLLVNIPPGTTKSTIVSQMFPAWVWCRMPSAKFVCVSYAQSVAHRDSVKMRDIVQSDKYQRCFPEIQLKEDSNRMSYFANTETGFRLSAGLDGQIMSFHGHFIIVDDPLNPKEAVSDAHLKSVNNTMSSTLPSRKIDKRVAPTILVQQRLHQSDPSGEMEERAREKGGLKHICLPGEISEKVSPVSLRSKYQNGLLDPVRLDRTVLRDLEETLGAYGYAGQIMQDPVPLGGGMFKTDSLVHEHTPPTKWKRKVRSWDKAATKDGGAYSAGVLMGLDLKGFFWVLDVVRGQWSATMREETMKATAELDGPGVEILIEIEGGSGGKESGESSVRNLAGYNVHTYHPTGDKEARAYPWASQVGSGNVRVLDRQWTRDFVEEMRFFPNSKYKDQIDAGSAAFNRLAKKKKRIGGWT